MEGPGSSEERNKVVEDWESKVLGSESPDLQWSKEEWVTGAQEFEAGEPGESNKASWWVRLCTEV